jgi:hypothetical protein
MGTSAMRSRPAAERSRQLRRGVGGVVQAAGQRGQVAQRLGAHVLAGFLRKAFQAQQVAQHAQHLPGRARITLRLDDAGEALRAAFGIDEGAGRLGERGDRQQHVGVVDGGVLERGERDHQARTRHGCLRLAAAASAASSAGSTSSSSSAFIGCDSICAADRPPWRGTAPTSCAPTVLAASQR